MANIGLATESLAPIGSERSGASTLGVLTPDVRKEYIARLYHAHSGAKARELAKLVEQAPGGARLGYALQALPRSSALSVYTPVISKPELPEKKDPGSARSAIMTADGTLLVWGGSPLVRGFRMTPGEPPSVLADMEHKHEVKVVADVAPNTTVTFDGATAYAWKLAEGGATKISEISVAHLSPFGDQTDANRFLALPRCDRSAEESAVTGILHTSRSGKSAISLVRWDPDTVSLVAETGLVNYDRAAILCLRDPFTAVAIRDATFYYTDGASYLKPCYYLVHRAANGEWVEGTRLWHDISETDHRYMRFCADGSVQVYGSYGITLHTPEGKFVVSQNPHDGVRVGMAQSLLDGRYVLTDYNAVVTVGFRQYGAFHQSGRVDLGSAALIEGQGVVTQCVELLDGRLIVSALQLCRGGEYGSSLHILEPNGIGGFNVERTRGLVVKDSVRYVAPLRYGPIVVVADNEVGLLGG